jgi:opacity protein-like surface antigen
MCISQVQAETFIAGQFGVGFPQDLANVNVGGPGLDRRSPLGLDFGPLYGVKLGQHFEATPWKGMGWETEVFHTGITIPQQPAVSSTGRQFVEPGARIGLTVAAINFTLRYPFEVSKDKESYFYPYVGFGPALFFARVRSQARDSSFGESQTTTLGFNGQGGVRYHVNSRWGFFAEYKYNLARLSFGGARADPGPINGTFIAHDFVVGVSYHLPP